MPVEALTSDIHSFLFVPFLSALSAQAVETQRFVWVLAGCGDSLAPRIHAQADGRADNRADDDASVYSFEHLLGGGGEKPGDSANRRTEQEVGYRLFFMSSSFGGQNYFAFEAVLATDLISAVISRFAISVTC